MKRILGTLLMVIFLAPTSAYAHTTIVSSNPKNGAVLTKSPTSITLTFNENLIDLNGKSVSRLSLVTSKGAQITLGKTSINKRVISSAISKALSSGSYKISYRVVSNDGHPVTGTINFKIR